MYNSKTKYVLITGASGGFGCSFAVALESLGYSLLLHGRDKARMQMTLDALKHTEKHRCIYSDISTTEGVNFLYKSITDELNDLQGLVNNAGFGVWNKFMNSEEKPQLDVLRTNLVAAVHITHRLLPQLKSVQGFIINVSSLSGETPLPYMSTYAAAKAGLTFWSLALAEEVRHKNVCVVTLAPGPSPTGFRAVSGMQLERFSSFNMPADSVIATAMDCLKSGGGYCVPNGRHTMLYLLQKLSPRWLSLAIMRRYLLRH
ncbi:MAG: SDR family NAD(P)-dependent oxidoreductase [Mariprofundales bacterium]